MGWTEQGWLNPAYHISSTLTVSLNSNGVPPERLDFLDSGLGTCLGSVTHVVDDNLCPAFPSSRAMDFPKPRDDPVTRQTLASSATICIEEDRRVANATGVAGAKAATDDTARKAAMNFMVKDLSSTLD
jgi:hypothetical protein